MNVKWNHPFFWALLIAALLAAGLSQAQAGAGREASVPRMVGSLSSGFVKLYAGATADSTTGIYSWRPWLLSVTATTDLEFNIWAYGFGASGDSWGILSPEFGVTAGDTVLTIAAGETETYQFIDRIKPSAIYVKSGTGSFKAE